MATKNLLIRGGADFSGLYKEMGKAQKSLQGFKTGITKAMKGVGIALGAAAIGKAMKDSVGEAMSVESSMMQLNRTMGASASTFEDWAKTQASAYGMARSEAYKYGATYSNLISSFSDGTKETTQRTTDLLKASAVVASATGRSMDDTMERIRSGLLGNTESIEDLGIQVGVSMIQSTKAFQQFANGRSWQQLSFQEQQQVRLMAILEQANIKYGDSLANTTQTKQMIFLSTLKNIQLNLGQAFLPIYNVILPALTALASKIEYITGIFAQFMQALFGVKQAKTQAQATSNQASAVTDLGDAYQEAGKKAQGSVAGFDEINNLTTGDVAGAGVAAGGSTLSTTTTTGKSLIDVEVPDISPKVQAMADKVKAIFGDLSSFIVTHKDVIVSAIVAIGTAFAAFQIISNWSAIIGGIKAAFAGLAAIIGGVSIPILLLAAAIGAAIGAFVYFYQTNESFRGLVDGILNAIKQAAIILWQNVLVPLGQFLVNVFVAAWNGLTTAVTWLWQKVLVPVGQFLGSVFLLAWQGITTAATWLWQNVLVPFGAFLKWLYDNALVPLGKILNDVIKIAFDNLSNNAKSFWKNVMIPLGTFLKGTFGPTVEAVSAVFTFLWDKVLKPLGIFLSNTLKSNITTVITVLTELWENVLKPVATFISNTFQTAFNDAFEAIGTVIGDLQTSFNGLMTFITGVFTADWEKAWDGVKEIFKGVFDSLYSIVKAPINLIIGAINQLINGINKFKIDIPSWAAKIAGIFGFTGGSISFNIPKIPELATGGIVGAGQLFMAREAGAELVGSFGGQTGVMNNDQIVESVSQGVYRAVMSAMGNSQKSGGDNKVIINLDGRKMGEALVNNIDSALTRRGYQTILRGATT